MFPNAGNYSTNEALIMNPFLLLVGGLFILLGLKKEKTPIADPAKSVPESPPTVEKPAGDEKPDDSPKTPE